MENAARMGELGLGRLREMMDRHPLIGDVRGRGCLLGAELVLDRENRTPAVDAADAVLYKALARGLNFKTTMGNVLTLTPPLIITEDQMRRRHGDPRGGDRRGRAGAGNGPVLNAQG